jgi:hypothetical protein
MQEVGHANSPSPDIAMIPAQGRDGDAVHNDIQNARWAAKEAKQMHTLARNADSMPVKNKLLTMMQEAHARRDMQPGSPNPDPDAPLPIP